MQLSDLEVAFPGILYDGDGRRLAGDGPDFFVPNVSKKYKFKTLICGPKAAMSGGLLEIADRLWVLPEQFSGSEGPPVLLIHHLAGIIHSGRKVGLASVNELTFNRVQNLLISAAEDAKGEA